MTSMLVTEARNVAVGIVLGALSLAAMQFAAEAMTTKPFIGEFIYNYYFLSLIDGSLTVPAQIAGLEGFYDAQGRAYLYHGLGPLITRALAWPFLDLTQVDLRAPTIWLFSTIGAAGFFATALKFLARFGLARGGRILVWLMVWVLAPGFVLAANGSFFHEPVAFAFAAMGVGTYCLWRLVASDFTKWRWLLGLALAGALAVHGRPHVAVGLYLATVFAALAILWRGRARALLLVSVAMLILLLSGMGYLQMNALRFGSVAATSGTVTGGGAVYGFLYWGWEPADHPRFLSNKTHGQFNAGRILPNLYLYGVSMGGEGSVGLYRRLTADLGHIRIEPPVLGFVMLWLPWVVLALASLVRRSGERAFLWLGLASALPGALVMLAYTTVTMRYRMELWPVFFFPALFAFGALLEHGRDMPEQSRRLLVSLGIMVVAAIGVSFLNVYVYHDILNWEWGTALSSYEDCARMVADHPGLGASKVSEICILGGPG